MTKIICGKECMFKKDGICTNKVTWFDEEGRCME